MKKYRFHVLLALCIYNCTNQAESELDLEPLYEDYKTSLQEKNIYGKVRTIEYYKKTFQFTDLEDRFLLKKIETFTNFGELSQIKFYNQNEKLIRTNKILFDDKQRFIESSSYNEDNERDGFQYAEYDTLAKTQITRVFINDKLQHKLIVFHDEKELPVRSLTIFEDDTTEVIYKRVFSPNNKIQFSQQEVLGKEEYKISNRYFYNDSDQLIKTIYRTTSIEMISEMEWKNQRRVKQTSFLISTDSVKHQQFIYEFDRFYNQTNLKEFKKSELDSELSFKYKFDSRGNWIEKTVSLNEKNSDSDNFTEIYIDKRKISYWD